MPPTSAMHEKEVRSSINDVATGKRLIKPFISGHTFVELTLLYVVADCSVHFFDFFAGSFMFSHRPILKILFRYHFGGIFV